MRRHARAVILLGGWVLMLPPLEKDPSGHGTIEGWRARDEKPVTSWTQEAAYDTARECERGRDAYMHEHVDSHGRKQDPAHRKLLGADGVNALAVRALAARCVPSESVYPPQPPAQK